MIIGRSKRIRKKWRIDHKDLDWDKVGFDDETANKKTIDGWKRKEKHYIIKKNSKKWTVGELFAK